MADEEIVVKIEEEAAKNEEGKSPVADLAEQFEDLKAREERERTARAAAEEQARVARQEADNARKEVVSARSQVHESQLDTITTALESASDQIDAAKRDIRSFGEAGDFEKQADAYERLAAAKATALRLEEAKNDLEARKKSAPAREERGEARRAEPPSDPVEAYIAGRTAPTQNWLRKHTDFITDQRKNQKLTVAHLDAVSDGLVPDSDEYFAHVENFLGIGTKKAEPRRNAAPPVAPGAGGGSRGIGNSSGGNEVRLTPNEARAATDGTHVWNYDDPTGNKRFKKGDPIGVQEFARRKLELQKQGAYDRTFTEG